MDVSEPRYATLALLWMVRPLLLRYRQGHSDDSIIVRPLATAIQWSTRDIESSWQVSKLDTDHVGSVNPRFLH